VAGIEFRPNSRMVELLLENNALPNHRWDGGPSAWEHVLHVLFLLSGKVVKTEPAYLLEWLKIVQAFLQHGADPTKCVTGSSVDGYDLIDAFKETFPVETRELKKQFIACAPRAQQRSRDAKLNKGLDSGPGSESIPNVVPPSLSRGPEVEGKVIDGIVQIDQGRTKTAPIRESLPEMVVAGNGKGKKVGRSWLEKIQRPSLIGKFALGLRKKI
jgi:hypothetical protein